MRCVRLCGARDIRVETAPDARAPMVGEVRIRVECVGICGSDLHPYLSGDVDESGQPGAVSLIPGHEFAGIVESTGEPIPYGDAAPAMPVRYGLFGGDFRPLHVGMRVAVDPAMPCRMCARCVDGNPNLCENLRFCGLYPHDGAMCERITVPAACCYPLDAPTAATEDMKPDGVQYRNPSLNATTGAMLEPIGVALHAVRLAKIRPGETVAVVGAGPIGLGIAWFARFAGAAQVIVTDRRPWRLDAARQWALADHTIRIADDGVDEIILGEIDDTSDGDSVAAVRRRVANGVDVAMEAAWCDESVQQAAEMLRRGGRLIVAGIPAEDRFLLRHSTARRRGLTIRMVRRMKHVYPTLLDLAWRGQLDPERLVTHRYSLADACAAFADAADGRPGLIKSVVTIE